jgi:tetratricopeptide (TPR) repeat protein
MPLDSSRHDKAWQQPQPNLLKAWIRWLKSGGPWQTGNVSTLNRPDSEPQELLLPPVDPARQAELANRYFNYGEELNQRGAPELAAAFYRQAYTMLRRGLKGELRDELRGGRQAAPGAEQRGGPGAELRDELRRENHASIYSHLSASELAEGSSIPSLNPGNPGSLAAIEAATLEKRTIESTVTREDLLQQIADMAARLSKSTAPEIGDELRKITRDGFRHPELYRLQGLTALHLQDTNSAMEHFREALAVDPMHYSSLVNLGGLLLPGGQYEEAITLLNRALQTIDQESPEALPALANLSLAHQATGRKMDEALLLLRIHRLKAGYIRNERLLTAATTMEQMGEDTSAIEILTWLSKQEPSNAILRPLASLLERRGQYKEAAMIYRQLLQEPK